MVTNKSAYGAYRGYGKDIANQLIERLLDRAAEALGIDPLELRRRNLVTEFPHQMCTGPIIESGSFVECLDLLEEKMDVAALRAGAGRRAPERAAISASALISHAGAVGGAIPMSLFSGLRDRDRAPAPGRHGDALTGLQPIGQGMQTSYAQVVADAVGVTPTRSACAGGTPTSIPYGLGAFASRGATFGVTRRARGRASRSGASC